jgi:hypothetical protein
MKTEFVYTSRRNTSDEIKINKNDTLGGLGNKELSKLHVSVGMLSL